MDPKQPGGLSDKYGALLDGLLVNIASGSITSEKFTVFWPMRGRHYKAFLVVGRATNGGLGRGWSPSDLVRPEIRRGALEETRRLSEPVDGCPMSWVTDPDCGYSDRRRASTASAFWRVTGTVVRSLLAPDHPDDWPGLIGWTNLYKVAPENGWNPGGELQALQRPFVYDLLRAEVAEFAPRCVLALTGLSWFSTFAEPLGLRLDEYRGFVEATATTDNCCWVIAKHPMRKPEKPFVREVLDAFSRQSRGMLNPG